MREQTSGTLQAAATPAHLLIADLDMERGDLGHRLLVYVPKASGK